MNFSATDFCRWPGVKVIHAAVHLGIRLSKQCFFLETFFGCSKGIEIGLPIWCFIKLGDLMFGFVWKAQLI